MIDLDFDSIYKNAQAKAKQMRLSNDECEEFAQEYAIESFEKGKYLRLDYFASEYSRRLRANKRILSHSEESLGKVSRISFDAPIDSEDSDSARLSDRIGIERSDVGCYGELSELNWTIERLLCTCSFGARNWAIKAYYEYLASRI